MTRAIRQNNRGRITRRNHWGRLIPSEHLVSLDELHSEPKHSVGRHVADE
jgi:hypothetical protein